MHGPRNNDGCNTSLNHRGRTRFEQKAESRPIVLLKGAGRALHTCVHRHPLVLCRDAAHQPLNPTTIIIIMGITTTGTCN